MLDATQDRLAGTETPASAGGRRARSCAPRPPSTSSIASWARRSASSHARAHRRDSSRRDAPVSPRARAAGSARTRVPARRLGSFQRPGGSTTICGARLGDPAPQRLAGRHVAEAEHEVGLERRRRACGRSGRRPRPRAAVGGPEAELRSRLGEDRHSRRPPRGRRRLGHPGSGWRPQTISARSVAERSDSSPSSSSPGSRGRSTAVSGRARRAPRARADPWRSRRPSPGSGPSGSRHERLRCTGPRGRRSLRRPRGRRSSACAQARVVGVVGADLAEPASRGAVEADLVDRLPGADPAQLRRAIGGQHEQRHRRPVGLDDGGVEVGGGRAGGAARATGPPLASAAPSAKKPALRSSRTTVTSISGWR